MPNHHDLRALICEIGRRMYARNLVAATDGNISVRLGDGQFLCTPSGVSKGFMQPRDLVIADGAANKVAGEGRVTSEFTTHLAAYEERPDIEAVVHAHPPKAIALTLAGISMVEHALPEVVYALGGIPTAPYATPATPEGAEVLRPLIRQCDAVMLDRHGSITVGVDLLDAYHKLEKLEHGAESLLTAHLLGNVRYLEDEEVQKLFRVGREYGVRGKLYKSNPDSDLG